MPNQDIDEAIEYHNVTKHSYVSVHHDRFYLDWANKPPPFKIYHNMQAIPLPDPEPPQGNALSAIRTFRPAKTAQPVFDLNLLAQMLFYSAGLIRNVRFGDEDFYFRTAASAGALYPTELYVVSRELPGLEPGVYHFSPAKFALHKLRAGDYRSYLGEATNEQVASSPVTIVFSSIFWRSAWKYRARSYRHCFWDAGMIAANLLAVAASNGVSSRVIVGFVDEIVNRLLGLDGENEAASCIVSLGQNHTPLKLSKEEAVPPITYEVTPISRQQLKYPEINRVHQASSLGDQEVAPWTKIRPEGSQVQAATVRLHDLRPFESGEMPKDSLGEVIRRRGSTRRFAPKRISFGQLSTILSFSAGGIQADFLPNGEASLLDIYLIVNDVEGLPTGAYYFFPQQNSVLELKTGKFRPMAAYLCLEQPVAGDASSVVFFLADLQRILKSFGNRGYRAAQLEAGIIGGKMYLCAYSLELGATGLTFYDDDVTDFFSPHAEGKEPILVVAIGAPAYRKRRGKVGIWRPLD